MPPQSKSLECHFLFLNINYFCNKFDNLRFFYMDNVGILLIGEKKIDSPFSDGQFLVDDYNKLFFVSFLFFFYINKT